MKCNHRRYKIMRTHGKKSKGYLVCKDCNQLINKKDIKKNIKWKKTKKR
jgi:hypothetical protein